MADDLDDVFLDDSDADIAISEWDRIRQSRIKDGFRRGFEAGQDSSLQAGFNQGYCEGVKATYQINYIKGMLSALKAYHEQSDRQQFSPTDKDAIREMLQELETLEQSQHALLQTIVTNNADPVAMETGVKMSSATDELNNVSGKFTQMYISQDVSSGINPRREITEPSSFELGGAVSTSGTPGAEYQDLQQRIVLEKLREISVKCTSLFTHLDITSLLQ